MSSAIRQTFQSKTQVSFSSHRFISSFAIPETPLKFRSRHATDLVADFVDPSHPLNELIRTQNPTVKISKKIHAHFVKTPLLQSDIDVANSLIECYCQSSAMTDALRLFEKILHPNLFSWNLMISGYNQNFQFEDSWKMFCRLHSSGLKPTHFTYGNVLSACSASQAPLSGKQVYSLAMKNGLFSNAFVRSGLIDLLAKSSSFEDALRVFQDFPCENVVVWNSIISGAVITQESWVALDLFYQMVVGFSMPTSFTFSSVLTACTALGELEMGKGVHAWVIKCGSEDIFVGTAIVDLYAKCGDIAEAVKEFSQMPIPNVVSWTAIISGFVQKEDSVSALLFFKKMRQTGEEGNGYTITSILTACAKPALAKEAIQIHSWILKNGFYSDSIVRNSLINLYSKIGSIESATIVFGEMGYIRNLGTLAVMISAFAYNRNSGRAIELFQKMFQEGLRPDKFCCGSVLSVIECLDLGRQIHCYTLKAGLVFDVSLASSLFTMYSICGSLEESYDIFVQIHDKDKVSWTSMISGFVEHGHANEAFQLFREMLLEEITPDQMTLSAILSACSTLQLLQNGKEVHGYALRVGFATEILLGGALVSMYSRCRALASAKRVFEMLPQKDQVSWSSLVSGYAQNGYYKEVLLLLPEMLISDVGFDCYSISSVFSTAAILTLSSLAIQLHAHVMKKGLDSDISVSSSLVTMYSKCGSIDDSCKVFDKIQNPDLVAWTALIMGYAQHGNGAEALRFYKLMREEGVKPDSVTFVGVLSACSHNGLMEEGYFHLNSMFRDYRIEPGLRHYACMVDLLGRSGRLKEAKGFIENMPIEPDALVWGTLLAACRVHGDIELGTLASEKVIELEPCDAGAYISVSNICADVGQWEEVLKIRSLMKETGVRKEPGCSSV